MTTDELKQVKDLPEFNPKMEKAVDGMLFELESMCLCRNLTENQFVSIVNLFMSLYYGK